MPSNRLQSNCLNFTELLGQAVALISPTMTAALIIPVMYSNTGDWSWMSYALGTLMLLFVAFNLNQFARRSTMSGSMYAYICHGLGITAGAIGGLSLIWAYIGIAIAGVTGFTIFSGKLLDLSGIHASPHVLSAVCVGIAWFCAWKNVKLSAMMMLVCEGVSMALILLLCGIVLAQHHLAIDTGQFNVSELPWSKVGLGVVVAIFSLVGFESATAFGDEAKNPLKTIPKAVNMSLLISGGFFVFVTYVMVMGTRGYSTSLDQLDAPLNTLTQLAKIPILQAPLSLGAMISFFALCLSCINAGSRLIYTMGRHGLFHSATASAHDKNQTPHIAISIMVLFALIVPMIATVNKLTMLDLFNYAGTCAAFGFMVPYCLITLAAPVYLKSLAQLRVRDRIGCAASLILLAIPAVGSVYPVPPAPVMYFPYVFLFYLALGIAWVLAVHKRKPSASLSIREDLRLHHDRHQTAGEIAAAK